MQIVSCKPPLPATSIYAGHQNGMRLMTKTALIMKLVAIFMLAVLVQAQAGTNAQSVTLSYRNTPLKTIFKEIRRQTGFNIIYNNNLLQHAGKVNVEVSGATIDETLQKCFRNQPLSFKVIDKTIIITRPEQHPPVSPEEADKLPPPIKIKGKVVDENGQPVVGASIKLKRSSRGTVTGAEGDFQLDIPGNSS